MAISTEPKKI